VYGSPSPTRADLLIGFDMRNRKLISALSAVGVVAALVALPGGPAQAQSSDCTATSFTPSTVNLGLSPVVETFNVVSSTCDSSLSEWSVDVTNLFVYAFKESPQEGFNPSDLTDSDAGTLATEVDTYGADGYKRITYKLPFHLKRYGTWGNTFNAGPEPIKKGSSIRFTGELLRANWDQGKYYGYGDGNTEIQFRARDTSTYHTLKTLRTSTSSAGHIDTTLKASRSGTWRVYYTGNAYGSPAYSKTDYVEVD
jgi:hypothetical protein